MDDTSADFKKWIVNQSESGQKLQTYLLKNLNNSFSSKNIKRALENNACSVNGIKERFASRRLFAGDVVYFFFLQLEKKEVNFDFFLEKVLYEDSEIIVYNKPAGISSDGSGLFSILQKNFPLIKMVHRLDKETSGAIIFAKTKKSEDFFLELFKQKKVKKEYLAIVNGVPTLSQGFIEFPIGKIRELNGQSIWGLLSIKKGGSYAATNWSILKKGENASLLKCIPITGKTHQIRVHLTSIGHPILGDKLYSIRYKCSYHAPRHFLHALALTFYHPINQKKIVVNAPIPQDMSQAIIELFGVGYESINS